MTCAAGLLLQTRHASSSHVLNFLSILWKHLIKEPLTKRNLTYNFSQEQCLWGIELDVRCGWQAVTCWGIVIKLGKEKRNYECFELISFLTARLNRVSLMEFRPLLITRSDMLWFHSDKGKITVNTLPSISAFSTVPKGWKIPLVGICSGCWRITSGFACVLQYNC